MHLQLVVRFDEGEPLRDRWAELQTLCTGEGGGACAGSKSEQRVIISDEITLLCSKCMQDFLLGECEQAPHKL